MRPGEAIPEPALRFVAEQIHVGADALAAYAVRRQTRQEQLDDLREAFGFRMYAPGNGREMLAWLLPVALATTNALAITTALMDELRRRRIVAPGPSVVERLVAAALIMAERHVAGQLTRNLSPAQTEALDALLVPKEGCSWKLRTRWPCSHMTQTFGSWSRAPPSPLIRATTLRLSALAKRSQISKTQAAPSCTCSTALARAARAASEASASPEPGVNHLDPKATITGGHLTSDG